MVGEILGDPAVLLHHVIPAALYFLELLGIYQHRVLGYLKMEHHIDLPAFLLHIINGDGSVHISCLPHNHNVIAAENPFIQLVKQLVNSRPVGAHGPVHHIAVDSHRRSRRIGGIRKSLWLYQPVDGVHAEAVHPHVQPPAHHLAHIILQTGIVPV